MAYIGKALVGILNENKVVDSMTGDGSDTTLTLSRTPGSVNNVEVFIDGIYQTPDVEYTLAGDTITFTSAPEVGVTVVAVSGADSTIINPAADSITGAKIVDNAITGAKVAALSASKLTGALPALSGSGLTGLPAANLTGALPALDGSALTNLPAANLTGALPAIDGSNLTGLSGVTKNASDPLVTTNPSGGLGQLFLNTTSGEIFVCTDATTDANVWTNVGPGTGDIQPYSFQGSNYGYVYGGTYPNGQVGTNGDVQKFSLTSNGNATDVGDQSVARQSYTAASSTTHGYCMGGQVGGNVIDKFPFAIANGFTMTNVGNLTQSVSYPSGMSTQSYGFRAGGSPNTDRIDRIDFSSDGDATDWANLHTARSAASNGISGTTHGYTAGGQSDQIQKFQFASQATGTDVGNLLNHGGHQSGTWNNQSGATSSATHGYVIGSSMVGVPPSTVIQKFPFASDTNSTDVGDLTSVGVFLPGTASSTTHGYRAGGDTSSGGTPVDIIDKHSFSADGNATDVGDMAHSLNYMGQGSQY
jgi:hypothetical protein